MEEFFKNWNSKNNVLYEYKIATDGQNPEGIFSFKEFEKYYFKIIFPKSKSEFMILDTEYNFSWIDDINIRIIERSYNLDKLLDQLYAKLKSIKKERLEN